MSKNKKIIGFVIAVLYSAAIAGVFYFIGYKVAYDRMENSASSAVHQTFYATISDIQGNTLTVKGMEINDINFRRDFCFSVVEETRIMWRFTDISIEDLDIGDNIAVTFAGGILEEQIGQVEMIQLLDDEK